MGDDGAKGIMSIRQAGGATLAQDEASSVIFGMNKVAIDSGSVQKVLPVDAIAREMIDIAFACSVASQP
jgi:two-component system chemotaxis response regulator CheB